MTRGVAPSSTERLEPVRIVLEAEPLPQVKVYRDSTGGIWKRIYVPVVPAEFGELQVLDDSGRIELKVDDMPAEDFREVEMIWLQEHQQELVALHPGEWIAIDGPRLVAHSGNLATLFDLAREAGHPNPFVTAMASEPVGSLHV